MARPSFSAVEYLVSCGSSLQLRYSTGRSSPGSPWARTAPSPTAEASVWTRNRWLKSGLLRTGKEHKQALRAWNSTSQSSFEMTRFLWSFAVRAVSGAATVANCGTNLLYQLAKPKKDLTSFFERGHGQLRMASTLSTCGRTSPRPS